MTCTDSIHNLNIYLQSLLDANTDACCQEFLIPTDITTYTSAITSTCTTTSSSITSSVSNRAYRLHNFDIPVHTLCDFLFRGDATDVTSIPKSSLWKAGFENIAPPRIDTLSSTSTNEYYQLLAWVHLIRQYIATAKSVNDNDAQMVEMAYQALCNDEQYFQEQLGTLRTDQCQEDILQDIIDDPSSCQQLYIKNREEHTRERLNGKPFGKRCRSKKVSMYVPLHRTAMQSYEHALVDSRFYQEEKEWQRKLDDNAVLKQNVEQKRLLGQSIGHILCQALSSFHRLLQLIEALLTEWQQTRLMCNTTELPLMRRMTFQQQLKATLFDVRALMHQSHISNSFALCENRCDTLQSYYAFFNYTTSSCTSNMASSSTTTTPASFVLDATRTLALYRAEQCVKQEMSNSVLQPLAAATRNDTYCVIQKLMKWRYMLLVMNM